MQWSEEKLATLNTKNGFHLRGESMTRMEVFSDAAFAFAMTMLVVSVGAIPQNFNELMLALKSIPAFALSFAQLAAFWVAHRVWSSRYGLEDKISTILTLLMIFTILVFVYPLRLIFSAFCTFISGGWLPGNFNIANIDELGGLFIVYGVGYAVLAGIVAALYAHALKKQTQLCLTNREIIVTRFGFSAWGVQTLFGLLSALFAGVMPSKLVPYSGFLYFGLAIVMPVLSVRYARKIRQFYKV